MNSDQSPSEDAGGASADAAPGRTSGGRDVLTVSPQEDGMRIDLFLARRFSEHSRGYFQNCIRDGLIQLNGNSCRRSAKVKTDDAVEITWPEDDFYEVQAQPVDFEILHEDDDVLVINKPPDLVVHPAQGNLSGTLVHGLMFHDEDSFADMEDDTHRPGIVHRLDKDTSGVMVVAKNLAARAYLKKAFKERQVEKTYLAVVLGEFGTVTGTIDNFIGRNPRNRMKMAVVPEDGKRALTKYRVLGMSEGCSLLEVRIFTGRTHQIRVHFSNLNHPILGDGLYGGRPKDALYIPKRQLLHAWKLTFPHPGTGIMRQYMGPVPEDFAKALAALGLPEIGHHPMPMPPSVPPEELDRTDSPEEQA
jgi:23S rRNA pseudouridine1911/1915/1917 synthase